MMTAVVAGICGIRRNCHILLMKSVLKLRLFGLAGGLLLFFIYGLLLKSIITGFEPLLTFHPNLY